MFMRVGPFLFIGHLIIAMESLILYKFSRGKYTIINGDFNAYKGTKDFSEPFPTWVKYSWAVIIIGIIAITIVLFVKRTTHKITDEIEKRKIEKEIKSN